MHPTFVDVENEFSEIAGEVERLSRLLGRADSRPLEPDSQDAWEAAHVCASATEKIYTECERVMARLASDIDHAPVTHSDGWHAALLRRMAHPFPGVRGAVISGDCYGRLDRLRAFRHRERNTYGINLDVGIVVERGREAVSAFAVFRAEIGIFFARLTP